MEEKIKELKENYDKAKELKEISDAQNDLKKINDCISYIEINGNYDERIFDQFIQDIVDKYREDEVVGVFYNSPVDQNKYDSNYQSLIALRNMLSTYIQKKSLKDTVSEIANV